MYALSKKIDHANTILLASVWNLRKESPKISPKKSLNETECNDIRQQSKKQRSALTYKQNLKILELKN